MVKKFIFSFLLLFLFSTNVHAQLIDNRELPAAELSTRPPFDDTDRSAVDSKDDKVYIVLDSADDITIKEHSDVKTTETTMVGNVRVRFDGSHLRAEKLIITVKDSIVINVGAYGNVEFTLNGTKYLVDSLNFQPEVEKGVMYNVRSVLGTGLIGGGDQPWFYRAEKVTILSTTRFAIDNVTLSTSPVRFDHFAIKAHKLWYVQGKVAVAVGMEYTTGQASFLWLPVFLQLDSTGALRSSFGSERRIGYYFINNIDFDTVAGDFEIGFDFYQTLGQYGQLYYRAPEYGILKNLEVGVKMANDIRILKDGDLYSQWLSPEGNLPNDLQRMSQFAWQYEIDLLLETNDISFEFSFMDKNDPFFETKFSPRSRFDDSEAINFAELINPSINSWYGYQGDAQPQMNTINRKFSFQAAGLEVAGAWELLQMAKPAEGRSNQFLNNFYDYELRSVTFPSITYDFGSADLLAYDHTTKSKLTIMTSDGKSNTVMLTKLPEFEKELSTRSNRTIQRQVQKENNGSISTNVVTNFQPVTITSIITNDYVWYDTSLSVSGNFKFSAKKTYGTNDSSMTQNTNLLNTNWQTIADVNEHEETGQLDFDNIFFDGLWSIENGVKFNYREVWSSFGANYTNSMRDSGFKVDYVVGTSLKTNHAWNNDEWYRTAVNFDTSISFNYPLYYLLRMQTDFVRESTMSWKNELSWEWLQWRREPILGLTLSAGWDIRERVPTEEQQQIIDTNQSNIYLDNRILDRVTMGAKTSIFWLNLGVDATVDILNTRTNNSSTSFVPTTGASFTNRFVGGFPKLLVEFAPPDEYHYIPKLVYKYNLFEQARAVMVTNNTHTNGISAMLREDKSFSLEAIWDVKLKNYQIPALYPFIYEISEFGFTLQYYQDFINIRNSFLSLDFVFGVKFTKYLEFRFTSQVLNRSIHLYFPEVYNGQQVYSPGEQHKNFFTDLGDAFKIWDREALERSSFKLQSLNFELIHDLDTWDMRVIFNLGRRVDEVKQVAFWEPYIGVAFTIKGSSTASIFPETQHRFVPAEYQ